MQDNLKILMKLHQIMADVDYLKKDKYNAFHNYTYVSEAAIKAKIHELFVKYKVMMFLSARSATNQAVRTNKGEDMLTTVNFHYRFVDVETGETVEDDFVGSGQDAMDKGVWKAVTGALKYILTSTFLIPTGDDPENDGLNLPTEDKKAVTAKATVKAAPVQAPVSKPAAPTPPQTLICGKDGCKGTLAGGKGRNGKFYGCSSYPVCRNWVSEKDIHNHKQELPVTIVYDEN